MFRRSKKGRFLPLAIAAMLGWSVQAAAQSWPSKPIKVIVPYPAGGSADLAVRTVTQEMEKTLGQPFILDFKPGAGARIGVDATAKSPPDGYTLCFVTPAPLVLVPYLYKDLPYDPVKSFAPVVLLSQAPFLVAISGTVPAKTLAEFIKLDKANPGKMNYASFGAGSLTQFMGVNFNAVTGTKLVHVPYKGSAPSLIALLAGESHVLFDQLASLKPANFQTGKLRALAVMGPTRLKQLPDVPTTAEAGFPGLEGAVWNAFVAPAGTPQDIVRRLNESAQKALADKHVIDVLANKNAQIIGGGPPERVADLIRDGLVKWGRIVKESGYKPE